MLFAPVEEAIPDFALEVECTGKKKTVICNQLFGAIFVMPIVIDVVYYDGPLHSYGSSFIFSP